MKLFGLNGDYGEKTVAVEVSIVKVHSGKRIQIPSEICKMLKIEDGNKIKWIKDPGGRFYIEKVEEIKGPRYVYST